MNVIWTDLAKTSVGMFQKGTVAVCGRELDENSYEAETETVDAEGLEIPDALLRKMCSGTSDKGVMFVEGRKATSSPRKLDVYYGDQKVATGELDMELSSVEDMYWFYSLHGAEDVDYFNLPGHYTPGNLMDGPKDRDVFFTHGFNVSAEDARAWGSEVFKRLWQSGSDARFHNRNASQDDIWFALAEYVPAVSSPVGGNRIWSEAGKDVNLNDNSSQGVPRPNGWGRAHNVFGASWFHSDMKDMAFFNVYKLYEQLVTKGSLQ